jgi:hypothetical protein
MTPLLPPSINRLLEATNSHGNQTEPPSSSNQNLVQVPAEFLQTLSKSIDDLRKDISDLRKDNSIDELQRDNEHLHEENAELRRIREKSDNRL